MPTSLDADIDRLYQLPLADFTAARNALAKQLGGSAATEIRALRKPTLAAWAVNQLHWRARPAFDAVTAAAERARSAQRAVLAGEDRDPRGAEQAHREAVRKALQRALELVEEGGHPVTGPTRDAIRRTLEALPGEERPGRLRDALTPSGFEALAGVVPIAARRQARPASEPKAAAPEDEAKYAERELFEATRALRDAERRTAEVRAAETAARIRAERLRAEINETRRAVEDLQRQLDRAEHDLDDRRRASEAAEARRDQVEEQVERLRKARAVRGRKGEKDQERI